MKRKLISVISILMIAALSACGPAAMPTLSAADAQGTALADAWIALTLTQAAVPTATETPIPPTPTETLIPVTPFPTVIPPTLPPTEGADLCNEPAPDKPKGDTVKVRFLNKTESSLNLAFGMTQENEEKECGTYNFTIGRYEEPEVTVLAGCYWGFAWVQDPPSTSKTPDVLCMTDTSKSYSIWITAEVMNFH